MKLSAHAIERYRDRVKPALELSAAAAELSALIPMVGVYADVPPAWAPWERGRNYITIGDDICLVEANDVIVTCLTRPIRGRF